MNKIIYVKPMDDYKIFVTFSDEKSGVFNVSPYLDKGIFTQLQNQDYFKQVFLFAGGVAWPNEQDFSADTIAFEMIEIEREENQAFLQFPNKISA